MKRLTVVLVLFASILFITGTSHSTISFTGTPHSTMRSESVQAYMNALHDAKAALSDAKARGAEKDCFMDYWNTVWMINHAEDTFFSCQTVKATGMLLGAKAAAESLCGVSDSDKDGVTDDKDKCPDTPIGVKVDENGCPLDTDGDGVPDFMDKCPGTPMGVKVDMNGCPPDSDGDGVPDYKDDCPGTPMGAHVDMRGCWVLENLNFDLDKSDIKQQDYHILNDVVEVLKKNPGLNIVIEGHTDNWGTAQYNQKLSERRANAVKEYLMQKGIDEERLTTKGYGLNRPAYTNETAIGRAKNRRVELTPVQ